MFFEETIDVVVDKVTLGKRIDDLSKANILRKRTFTCFQLFCGEENVTMSELRQNLGACQNGTCLDLSIPPRTPPLQKLEGGKARSGYQNNYHSVALVLILVCWVRDGVESIVSTGPARPGSDYFRVLDSIINSKEVKEQRCIILIEKKKSNT